MFTDEVANFGRLGNHQMEGNTIVRDRYISLRIFCAELYGTALFLYFGDGCMSQVLVGTFWTRGTRTNDTGANSTLYRKYLLARNPYEFDYGDFLTVAFGYGLGLTLAIAACGAVSGGHLNPAVTLTEVVFRRLPSTVLPVYIIAQFFGAFIGIGFVHTVQSFKLSETARKDVDITAIFFTSPILQHHDILILIWDQVVGAAIYMFVYLAMDDKNTGIKSKPLRVVILGATYMVLLLAMGINAGVAINPARDFVPRIFAYIVGHQDAFSDFTYIPLVVPVFGCILGGCVYEVCIRFLRPEEAEDEEKAALENIMKMLDELEGQVRGMKSQTVGTPVVRTTSLGDQTTTQMEQPTTAADARTRLEERLGKRKKDEGEEGEGMEKEVAMQSQFTEESARSEAKELKEDPEFGSEKSGSSSPSRSTTPPPKEKTLRKEEEEEDDDDNVTESDLPRSMKTIRTEREATVTPSIFKGKSRKADKKAPRVKSSKSGKASTVSEKKEVTEKTASGGNATKSAATEDTGREATATPSIYRDTSRSKKAYDRMGNAAEDEDGKQDVEKGGSMKSTERGATVTPSMYRGEESQATEKYQKAKMAANKAKAEKERELTRSGATMTPTIYRDGSRVTDSRVGFHAGMKSRSGKHKSQKNYPVVAARSKTREGTRTPAVYKESEEDLEAAYAKGVPPKKPPASQEMFSKGGAPAEAETQEEAEAEAEEEKKSSARSAAVPFATSRKFPSKSKSRKKKTATKKTTTARGTTETPEVYKKGRKGSRTGEETMSATGTQLVMTEQGTDKTPSMYRDL